MSVSKRQAVNLTHMLFVAPLLLFVGIKGEKTPKWVFKLLILFSYNCCKLSYLFIFSQM